MKVFSRTIIGNSFCLVKILNALKKYAPPNVVFVDNYQDADLVLLHINGRHDHFQRFIDVCKKPYVAIQYCIRGTRKKKTTQWRSIWDNAEMVWSYYELDKYIKEEGGDWSIPNFYHSPLGADEDIFTNRGNEEKQFIIMSSGWSPKQAIGAESFNEILEATVLTNKKMFHLGRTICNNDRVIIGRGITDEALASRYRSCCYVSGLRRTEGFEMPAVEGLFCGARPIMYDQPHYRQWHDKWGIFIPEDNNVTQNLVKIFQQEYIPISNEEREEAVEMFNWRKIIIEFWRKLI